MGAGANGTATGPGRWRTVAIFSRGIARIPHLGALLGAERVVVRPTDGHAARVDAVVGWGNKANTAVARDFAERHHLPYWRAEDGFLRSIGLGHTGEPPLSMVLDDAGIYYDARQPSRLEQLLVTDGAGDPLDDPALLERARAAMARIRAGRLSKYNGSPVAPLELGPVRGDRRVLVVDQTRGDLSVGCGLADAASFEAMLAAALAESPEAEILVKTHPDVVSGAKRGYLEAVGGRPRVRLLADAVNPIALLEEVDRVYVVTSQLGFEALMLGKPVTCFGVPFYAGWGLTDDRADVPRRGRARTVEQLFAAAYLLYPRYVDPDSGEPCEIEPVIEHLALQRAEFARNRGTIYCFGYQFWKRRYVRAYLRCPGNEILFCRSESDAAGCSSSSVLLSWGQRGLAPARALASKHGAALWRMEDGFLRSVGLGSDLVTPASLVVDREGIYYDPTSPSELESILEQFEPAPGELERARALREFIVAAGLSKYNVGRDRAIDTPAGKTVVLVPGQVEDDASIQLGCRDIGTNAALLAAARQARPEAFIVYKPHPDVLSGNRRGQVSASAARAADLVVEDSTLAQCLAAADEIHTMTSLVGFEALLRGLRVVVYGQPFYSGWGLTEDRHPLARRTRKLTLDALVAGALIRYARYLNPDTGRFTTPERTVARLRAERDRSARARALKMSWPRRQLRKLIHVYKGVTYAH